MPVSSKLGIRILQWKLEIILQLRIWASFSSWDLGSKMAATVTKGKRGVHTLYSKTRGLLVRLLWNFVWGFVTTLGESLLFFSHPDRRWPNSGHFEKRNFLQFSNVEGAPVGHSTAVLGHLEHCSDHADLHVSIFSLSINFLGQFR